MSLTTDTTAGFPTRQVLRMLDLSEGRLRYWVRSGFVDPARGPGNRYRFRFQDLIVLRTAQALMQAGLPARRVRLALDALRRELPVGRSLSAVRVLAKRGEVVVQEGGRSWEPATGQWLLDLDAGELAAAAEPLSRAAVARLPEDREELIAAEWYELGLDLEAVLPEEAERAYRHAIDRDPSLAAAYLNLGRLRHEEGDLEEAEALYRGARDCSPTDPTAAFNLGVVLQDAGRWAEAAKAYRCAIDLDSGYADAYFNLAAVYEQLGEAAVALQSLQAYRRLIR